MQVCTDMTLQTEIRGYIRGIPALPVERQRELAAIAKCRHVYEWGEHGRSIDTMTARGSAAAIEKRGQITYHGHSIQRAMRSATRSV